MENNDPFIVRVGTFFVVMGGGALVLFVISDLADKVNFDYFFLGALLIGIGWMFRRKRTPPPPTGRFSGIRGIFSRGRQDKGQSSQKDK